MPGNTRKRYPAALKARAVRMYHESRSDHETDWAARTKVSQLGGIQAWSGWVYVAFVIDAYARRILVWRTGDLL